MVITIEKTESSEQIIESEGYPFVLMSNAEERARYWILLWHYTSLKSKRDVKNLRDVIYGRAQGRMWNENWSAS